MPARDIDLGIDELRRDLESTVIENYQQLSLGNIEAYVDGISSDVPLNFFGVIPGDVIIGRSPRAIHSDRRLYRTRGPTLLTKNLDAHVARDGSVGWVYDELSYRVPYMGREASIPIRSTQIYVRDVERWVIAGEHLSYALDSGEVVAMGMSNSLDMPISFKSARVGPRELAEQLETWVLELHRKAVLPRGGASEEAVLLHPAPEEEYWGENIAGAPPLLASLGTGGTLRLVDRRVVLSTSGTVAWLFGNLRMKSEVNGRELAIGLRGSYVFQRVGEEWALEQAHVSVPLEESQLSMRVFGPSE